MQEDDKSTRLLKWVVRRPATYNLLRIPLELSLKDENSAYKTWIRFLLNNTRRAFQGNQPVIWMSAFTPVELAYGLGAVPFMPEIIACLAAYLGWSRHPITLADTHISTDLCSFYRSALGLNLDRFLPRPDLIISSSHLCDGANKFFSYLSRMNGCPHFMLDPPYRDGPSSQRYMAGQIRDLSEEACRILGLRLKEENFSRAICLSNQARSYAEKTNLLRRARPSPFPGSEGLSYLAGMNFYSFGSKQGVEFYRELHSHINNRVKKGKGYLPKEKHRLLWLHHIRPYYKNEIFQILEKRSASVSFEEANYLYWPPLTSETPWEGLASKVLANVWAGPIEKRLEAILCMVKEYSIDGVIHFSHWGCRQSTGGAGIIGDMLKERGIPYIILPGDGADQDNHSPGQTRTRLEALVEMLEQTSKVS